MPAGFTSDDVRALAALAQLELDPPDVERVARQLGAILDYATRVQQIDTTGVPPTASVAERHEGDRPDDIAPSLNRDEVLAAAPDAAAAAGFFRVPRVIG
jgi:aspartyl-tRNA(Asn)/glutamyl-tRNA(Gln) amidotransferase subunit C